MPDAPPPSYTLERIEAIRWQTPSLALLTLPRPGAFRFTAGHYARLGLDDGSALVWRAYSIASPPHEARLDFQHTRVPGGAFSELLARAAPGSPIAVDRRSFGFLTVSQLQPGGTLWLLATGTGLAPFLSILADPATWKRHARAILVHSVRYASELMPDAVQAAFAPMGQEPGALQTIPVVTREDVRGAFGRRMGLLIESGELEARAGRAIEPSDARVMLCGNPEMIRDCRTLLRKRGLEPGRRGSAGQLASEGYW